MRTDVSYNYLEMEPHEAKEIHSIFYKNVVFPAQVEYSYFSADFRLKYSCIILKFYLMTFPF